MLYFNRGPGYRHATHILKYLSLYWAHSLELPRSSIWNKDLLLHINPYKTLKNVHTKTLLISIQHSHFQHIGMIVMWHKISVSCSYISLDGFPSQPTVVERSKAWIVDEEAEVPNPAVSVLFRSSDSYDVSRWRPETIYDMTRRENVWRRGASKKGGSGEKERRPAEFERVMDVKRDSVRNERIR